MLERIENTGRIAGVIVSGTLHSRAELDEQMADFETPSPARLQRAAQRFSPVVA
jgi:hypothetical protein